MTTADNNGKVEPLADARAAFEREYLEGLIKAAGGNVSEAARIAGVDRTTLYKMAERLGVSFDRSGALEPAGAAAE